jgi:hypothetical protein
MGIYLRNRLSKGSERGAVPTHDAISPRFESASSDMLLPRRNCTSPQQFLSVDEISRYTQNPRQGILSVIAILRQPSAH